MDQCCLQGAFFDALQALSCVAGHISLATSGDCPFGTNEGFCVFLQACQG